MLYIGSVVHWKCIGSLHYYEVSDSHSVWKFKQSNDRPSMFFEVPSKCQFGIYIYIYTCDDLDEWLKRGGVNTNTKM